MVKTRSATGAPASAGNNSNANRKKFEPIYTEEKALRMIRIYTATLSMSLLVGWSQLMILQPLQDKAIEMQHMDPSEIAAVPLPLLQVTAFVLLPVAILLTYWLVKNPSTMAWNVLNLIKLTGVIYAFFGLAGNYLIQNWQHSLTTALFVATLLATTVKEEGRSDILKQLPFHDLDDVVATCRLYMTLLLTIPFQILTVLDHGLQIQRWPAPVLLGSTYGYAIGTIMGIFTNYINRRRNENKMQ